MGAKLGGLSIKLLEVEYRDRLLDCLGSQERRLEEPKILGGAPRRLGRLDEEGAGSSRDHRSGRLRALLGEFLEGSLEPHPRRERRPLRLRQLGERLQRFHLRSFQRRLFRAHGSEHLQHDHTVQVHQRPL